MINIILAIVCSSAITVTMKVSDRLGQSGVAILCVNYLFATIFSLIAAVRRGNTALITPAVFVLGIITGVLFLVTFILNQASIVRNGAVLSATAMKMGIVVPILISQVIWKEQANLPQGLGIVLAIAAILIMTWNPGGAASEHKKQALWLLPLLLLSAGFADSTSKFYSVYGVAAVSEWYMFLTFLTAFLLCFPMMLRQREHFNRSKLELGSVLGLVNYASSWFLLMAVAQYPAFFVYPLVNVLIIALITLICMTAFQERLTRRQQLGMGLVLIAVILLNL